jgi:hypothetical protein
MVILLLEGGSWKGCKNVKNKELVVYSYEQRRMQTSFKGGQDSYRVVESMMMIMSLREAYYMPVLQCSTVATTMCFAVRSYWRLRYMK